MIGNNRTWTDRTAILVDLDETLIADQAATKTAIAETVTLAHQRYGIDRAQCTKDVWRRAVELWSKSPTYGYCQYIGISAWEGLWGRFAGKDAGLHALAQWMPTFQLAVWQYGLQSQGVNDDAFAQELMDSFQRHRRATHIVFPEVVSVLQSLRQRYRIAIVTNGAPDLQQEKIAGARLGEYFDVIVISGQVGHGKPDPRVFQSALSQLGVTASEAVMVGDNAMRDIGGAQDMGIGGIWVRREQQLCPPAISPNATINSLTEIAELLS